MARIILGVTGSVAAVRTPNLVDEVRAAGHQVRIAATESSLYFFDATPYESPDSSVDSILFRDRDEWPGSRYHRGAPVLHIELRRWADMLVVAPLDANTLAKFALGICDNLLSCVYRAWDPQKPIVLAPAMNTVMWEHPATLRHLRQVVADHSDGAAEADFSLESLLEHSPTEGDRLIIIPPQAKALACGDVGVGAMAEVFTITSLVQSWLNRTDTAG